MHNKLLVMCFTNDNQLWLMWLRLIPLLNVSNNAFFDPHTHTKALKHIKSNIKMGVNKVLKCSKMVHNMFMVTSF